MACTQTVPSNKILAIQNLCFIFILLLGWYYNLLCDATQYSLALRLQLLLHATKPFAKLSYFAEKRVYFLFKKHPYSWKLTKKKQKWVEFWQKAHAKYIIKQKAPTSRRGFWSFWMFQQFVFLCSYDLFVFENQFLFLGAKLRQILI